MSAFSALVLTLDVVAQISMEMASAADSDTESDSKGVTPRTLSPHSPGRPECHTDPS